MTRLARHYTTRSDYRAGELCEAEWEQDEPVGNPTMRLTFWVILAWVALCVGFTWTAFENWTAESRDRPAGEIHNTGPVVKE